MSGSSVVVSGRLADFLSAPLRKLLEDYSSGSRAALHPDVVELLACLDEAGRTHRMLTRAVEHYRSREAGSLSEGKSSESAPGDGVTVAEVALLLEVSPRRVRQIVADGDLRVIRKDRPMLLDRREVLEMVKTRERAA